MGISIILITHDLGVVANIADRIAVMYAGKIIEVGTTREVFYEPEHPYTQGLLHSVPRLDTQGEKLISIDGTPPDLFSPPQGCPFTARCSFAMEVCEQVYPVRTERTVTHHVACWLQDERAQKRRTETEVHIRRQRDRLETSDVLKNRGESYEKMVIVFSNEHGHGNLRCLYSK